jgi:hypothetical protein
MDLLSFNQFVNEGAYLGDDDLVHITYQDDKNNPDEVLKTGDADRGWFRETPVSNRAANAPYRWTWPIFWGMGPNGISPELDHPGRIKYTMDKLKKAEIADIGPSLDSFIKTSFSRLGITGNFRPDYVVTVGSTAGLVNQMATSIKNAVGSEVEIIELPKVVYFDAYDAFDWDEVNRQVEEWGEKTFKKAKTTIYNYVNANDTPNELKKAIRDSSNVAELKRAISTYGVVWKDVVAGERVKPFIVRSSGRTSGGDRSFWKNKYDYETTSFIEAVVDCAVGGSRMLIIDDNRHTGTDMKNIRRNIEEIVSKLDSVRTDPANRFAFYVLYRMPVDKKYTDFKGNTQEMKMDAQTVHDFERFLKGDQLDDQTDDNLEQ